MTFVLAIDQGSSSTKALVYDCLEGTLKVRGGARVSLKGDRARDIITSVRAAACEAMRRAGARGAVSAVGIANQRSTLCWFRRDGTPVGRVVPWWSEAGLRAEEVSDAERKRFRAKTGLVLLPNWWGGKLARTRRPRGAARVGTVDALVLAYLTAGRSYRTDLSNAARTGLVDIGTGTRDPWLLRFFGVPEDLQLPEVAPSASLHGRVEAGRLPGAEGAPILALVGDAGAALYSATGGRFGIGVLTLGTGGFLQVPAHRTTRPPEGVYLAPAWKAGGRTRFAFEVSAGRLPKDRTTAAERIVEAARRLPLLPGRIVAGGGRAADGVLLEKIARRLGVSVEPADDLETTARGAAALALSAATE